jgi:peroxiredoxin family protein
MTAQTASQTHTATGTSPQPIERVSIVVSRGSLEGVYPGLILANGARMEGIEATLFFTFFGLDAIVKKQMHRLKVSTVGNPALHMPTLLGALPGISALATAKMKKEIEKLDIPPVGEFLTMIHDAGCGIYACRATVEMFHLQPKDFAPEVDGIISVGQFYEKAAGGQILFT